MIKYVLISCLMLWTIVSTAQSTPLKGFVKEEETGEAIAFAIVKTVDGTVGAKTNIDGYYSIPEIPDGNVSLRIIAPGYESLDTTVTINAGVINTLSFFLVRKTIKAKTIEISAKKIDKTTEVNVGLTKITAKDIKSMASVGGEPDLAQYLQLTPGVVFTGDQGGQLYIRGGSPVQNKIMLDGMTIYNPFHSIGLYSVFETDLIRNTDVITGGFGAEYGDRTSSIISVATKDGNKNEFGGKISASPIMARLMLEGPLGKKGTKGANTSFILSAKYSYLDKTSKALYGGLGDITKQVGLPYSFADIYGKVTFGSNTGSKMSLFGFNFSDKNQFPNIPSYKWNSTGGGMNFLVSPSSSTVLMSGKFTYSNYVIQSSEPTTKPRKSSISGFEAGLNFSYFLPNYSELKYGFEVQGFNTSYNFTNAYNTVSDITQFTTQAAGFVQYRKNFNDKFILEPSLRMMYYSSISAFSPEPRLAMKYNITTNLRMKFATGVYSQNVISTKSDQDIVNYFTGFISGPEDPIVNAAGQAAKSNLQRAYHFIGGIEMDANHFEFSLEPWYKLFNPIININRLKVTKYDSDFIMEKGIAKGVDFSLKYAKNNLRIQAVYSYMHVTRSYVLPNGSTSTYFPPFDRRNNLNISGVYSFGQNKSWSTSGRFNFGSALPFTLTQAFYQSYPGFSGGPSTDLNSSNGSLGLLFSNNLNTGRLSDYARFDWSIEKVFKFKSNSSLNINFSITNVFNRQNIFYIDRVTNARVYQLPILPSLALTYHF